MRRIVAAMVPTAVGLAVVAPARGEDGPALTPPVVSEPVAEPPGELPRVLQGRATPLPSTRPGPVLVVPGLTTPRGGSRPSPSRPATTPGPEASLPALVGPDEMRGSLSLPPPLPEPIVIPARPGSPSSGPRTQSMRPPITLESEPADISPLPDHEPERSKPAAVVRDEPPARRRPGGLFGRLFAPPAPINRPRDDEDEPIKAEPKTDPASDAALKRRIESQIRDNLAGKVRWYEVRVVGRDVTIAARPSRFWQKRGLRTALESLPALQGLKARIDVAD